MRVSDFLTDQQVRFEKLLHPPAFTAQKRAKYLHVPGRQVAKSVLLRGPDGWFLAVLPAPRHIDTARLADALGGPVRLATDREAAEVFLDCEWGVVPPFGRLYGLPVVLDEQLNPDALMVFEGNLHAEAVRLRCRDFERLERPRRLAFAC
ncbi:MAG TPA: YbaK/EbsC family protein [Gemmataceae bacterium]|nr:YbaK/EbsC family protein [Gemmataceae bacterium]